MAKPGPKEAQRRELRRRVAAEAIAHQRRPALEELPEGVTRGMPPEPPKSAAGEHVPEANIGALAVRIVSGEPRERVAAISDPQVEALAALLGTTAAELVASLNYYRAHKRAVAARKRRLRNPA